ncbi:hypothetical protein ACOSP7_024418 [Xanthoceras sorbifolium]
MAMDPCCLLGCSKAETSLHAIWGCKKLKSYRAACGALAGLSGLFYLNLLDFLVLDRTQLVGKELEFLCVVCWRLWSKRNNFVHGKLSLSVEDVVDWSRSYLRKFHATIASSISVAVLEKAAISWTPPPPGS